MPAKTINLLPRKDFDKTTLGKFLRWSLTYGRYIIICTEIIVLLAFIYRFSLDRQITDLGDEIDQKSAIISANQVFELQFRNLQSRTNHIGELFTNQDLVLKIIHKLETITPAGIKYTNFSYSGRVVNIVASTQTNIQLAQFLNNLNATPQFTKINIESISKTKGANGTITFQFSTTVLDNFDNQQAFNL